MFRKVTLILLASSILMAHAITADTTEKSGMSLGEAVAVGAIGAGVVAAAIIYAPVIVPASAITAIQGSIGAAAAKVATASAAVSAKAAAVGATVATKTTAAGVAVKGALIAVGPTAFKINLAYTGIKIGGRLLIPKAPTDEDRIKQMSAEESLEFTKAKNGFEECLNTYGYKEKDGVIEVPEPCKEVAMLFAMLAKAA